MVANASENGTAKAHNGHREAIVLTKRHVTAELERTVDPWKKRQGGGLEKVGLPHEVQKLFSSGAGLFGIRGALGGEDELKYPYVESWIFHTCTRARADARASVPGQILDGESEDAKPIKAKSGPLGLLAKLMVRPSPYLSWAQLKDATEVQLCESGESFWFLATKDGQPVATNEDGYVLDIPAQIIPVSGELVSEKRDLATGLVTHWGFQAVGNDGRELVFPRAAVVQFRIFSSQDPQRGIGPAQVLARQLSMAFQFERYQEANARFGGPGGWLVSGKPMGADEQDLAQNTLDDVMQDEKAPSTVKLLVGDWEFLPNPANPKQMLVIEMMQENVRIVCSTMRVPPPIIGRIEEAKYANMAEARAEFWLGIANDEARFDDTLNAQLFSRLKVSGVGVVRYKSDLSNISALNVDESDRYVKAKAFALGSGASTNAVLDVFGLERVEGEGADIAWMPSGHVPVDIAKNGPPEPSPSVSTPPPNGDAPAKHGPALHRRGLFSHVEPLGAEERRAYSDAYIQRILAPFEKTLFGHVRTYRLNYARAQLAQIEAFANGDAKALLREFNAGDDEAIANQILLDRQRWAALLDSATRSTLRSAWDFALSEAGSELGVIALPMSDPRVLEAFSAQMVKLTEGVTSRLAEAVHDTIEEVLRESGSVGTLQARIKQDLDEITGALNDEATGVFGRNDARALNIARTETGHAASTARFLQFKAEGVKEIQWVEEGDDIVRESHAHGTGVGGQVVKLGARFSNGLLHPHDPEGPAAEVCACRCSFIAIIRRELQEAA